MKIPGKGANFKFGEAIILSLIVLFLIISPALAQAQSSAISGIIAFNTKYEPYPAEPGKYLDVWFSVRNKADRAMENIVLKLEPEYPFTIDRAQDAYYTIDYLGMEAEALVHFRVRVEVDAIEGVNELNLRQYAGSDPSASTLEKFYIQVVGRKNIEIAEITPLKLKPGELTDLNFTIINRGKSPLRDITFTWSESRGAILPVGSDNKRYLQVLEVDQKAQLSFKVITNSDIAPEVYSLSMNIQYTDINGSQRNISSVAGIVVRGNIELVLTDLSVKSEGLNRYTIKGNIANVGSAEARSVLVAIVNSSASIKSSEPLGGYFIGTIKGDDFSSFELGFTLAANNTWVKPEKVDVPLLIQYVDTDNHIAQEIRNLPVELQQSSTAAAEQNFSPLMIAAVILLFAAIAGIIAYSWKKARK